MESKHGVRKDLDLALESVSGNFVMVTNTSNNLIRSKAPPAFCSGVQQITRILRRGDVSAFESCPDGRFIVSRRGYNRDARNTQVLKVGSLAVPLYFIRRGDRTNIGDSRPRPVSRPSGSTIHNRDYRSLFGEAKSFTLNYAPNW